MRHHTVHALFAAAVAVYAELNATRGVVEANPGADGSVEQHFYHTIGSSSGSSVASTSGPVVGVSCGVHRLTWS